MFRLYAVGRGMVGGIQVSPANQPAKAVSARGRLRGVRLSVVLLARCRVRVPGSVWRNHRRSQVNNIGRCCPAR